MEEELIHQGRTKDAAALNATLEPFNVTGVEALSIIHANADKIDHFKTNDDNNGIIAVNNIPQ